MLSSPDHWRVYPLVLAGIGLGGFFDGIVFHFILQWHQFASNWLETDSVNALERIMVIDGTFHISMWLVMAVALYLIWQAGRRGLLPGRPAVFAGLVLLGWGAFNVFDGVVFHLVFQVHNAREASGTAFWNAAWIVWGAAFMGLGWMLAGFGERGTEG